MKKETTMLSEFLKKYREKNNLTQKEMSSKVGTSQAYYSQIESGIVSPGFTMVKKIAKALDIEESFVRSLM